LSALLRRAYFDGRNLVFIVNAPGVPDAAGSPITVPAKTPVIGNAMGWFSGRVYAPSGTLLDRENITVVFAGYHTQKPKKNGLGDYRTIGHVSLHSSEPILAGSGDKGERGADNGN
jgi:hypothetical protein